ncbi:MAG: hypothetical protein KGM42_02490 [Hyphomicrobiales bacterium]|nr:hypothetical protein [Hyphomicrobiales bacterium]
MSAAHLVVFLVEAWLGVGCVVGLWFVAFAIDRIDPSARGAYAFRPLLLPGLALLWPYVIRRYLRLRERA